MQSVERGEAAVRRAAFRGVFFGSGTEDGDIPTAGSDVPSEAPDTAPTNTRSPLFSVQVAELTIRNFRNLAQLDLAVPSTGMVVVGDNGHGKTNLLEAIYYLVLFRSIRGVNDSELVRFGERGFFVGADGRVRVTAGYELGQRRKKVTVDGQEIRKLGEAVGALTAVSFSPVDRVIVAGGPGGRRRYLDVLLSLSVPGYLASLSRMRVALKQRNAALRRGETAAARAFDDPFVAAAEFVVLARTAWVSQWSSRFGELCGALGEPGEVGVRYHSQSHADSHDGTGLRALLDLALERDTRRGATTVGPHRHDLEITLDGRHLRSYGSAGQQRTAAIALRLLEAETLAKATNRIPIALYDDVFAELDDGRQARLVELIGETLPGQTVVTAPRESEVPTALLQRPRWRIRAGTIVR